MLISSRGWEKRVRGSMGRRIWWGGVRWGRCSYERWCAGRQGGAGLGVFFFSSRRRHTRFDCDWSSDVCSSDLGLTMGADPIVVAVSVVSGKLHGFLVRKAEKQHGTGQRIEGFREPRARVVIVDDVCTTGASTVQAIEAARAFGFEIVGAMCLVEREEANGRPNVEKAAAPAEFVTIFTARDVRAAHVAKKKT